MALLVVASVTYGAYRKPWAFAGHWRTDAVHAHNLVASSTFSAKSIEKTGIAQPQRMVPPGYPAVLAGLAMLDAEVAQGLACYAQKAGCALPAPFNTVVLVQIAVAVATLALVYLLALDLTASPPAGAVTVLLYMGLGRAGEYARFLEPDVVRNCLLIAGFYGFAVGYRTAKFLPMACAGILLGLATLNYPYYAFLILLLPALVVWGKLQLSPDVPLRAELVRAALFALSAAVVVLPWSVRNAARA